MKKVEIRKKYGNKETIFIHYEWRFTEEEKSRIREALLFTAKGKKRNIASEEIETFINHLEFLCQGKKSLIESPKEKKIRSTRERILIDCKAALNHLKKIERGKIIIWNHGTLDSYGAGSSVPYPVGDFIEKSFQNAWDAVGPLENFIKHLEEYHRDKNKKPGRDVADNDHFIRKVRDVYIEHIGRPTTYKDGPFSSMIKVILDLLELPHDYPERSIKAALKNVDPVK